LKGRRLRELLGMLGAAARRGLRRATNAARQRLLAPAGLAWASIKGLGQL
jgi:hypothetical protein